MASKQGEPYLCLMVSVPVPEDEDRRRIGQERKALVAERKGSQNDDLNYKSALQKGQTVPASIDPPPSMNTGCAGGHVDCFTGRLIVTREQMSNSARTAALLG
ncbi:hypothetical protein [Ensifer aridi]|uniref:hypothetical protein n=1 Tax=Ensifer aridi TaxID=1708715 RepID=UPI00111C03EB|nr:hypothetical protein [Ensifer aridi]